MWNSGQLFFDSEKLVGNLTCGPPIGVVLCTQVVHRVVCTTFFLLGKGRGFTVCTAMRGAQCRTNLGPKSTQHTTTSRWAAAAVPPSVSLPSIANAMSAMPPNHWAIAPCGFVGCTQHQACSCHVLFPWLGHQHKTHQKIERCVGLWP
jgi:hypothetical protein